MSSDSKFITYKFFVYKSYELIIMYKPSENRITR